MKLKPLHDWAVIVPGEELTVTTAVDTQPVGEVKLMTDVPGDDPSTTPEELPITATDGVALLQVPPVGVLSSEVRPLQTVSADVGPIAPGLAVTVIRCVT